MSSPSVQASGSGLAARRGRRSGEHGFHRRELSLFVGAYVVYHAARWLFTGDLSQAQWHAESIMRFERELGLAVEASVQDSLDVGLWSPFFSYVYMAAQLVVLPGALVWLYRRAPGVYRPLRNTVLGTWLIAIPIYAIFPVAPPRLAHPGIVDAVSEQAAFALTGRSTLFFNPLAAVPSLHVGFAFAIGIAAAAALRAPAAKALALLWGPLVSLAVVVTGNHYVFDIAAGLVVTAVGFVAGRLALRLPRPAPAQGGRSHERPWACRPLCVSERPDFVVEYLEPVGIEAEPLPDEFSPSRLRRSLVALAAVVLVVVAAVVLVPGLGSLRSSFMGAQPGLLAVAAVLQLGSCVAYVFVFRGVFCRRMSWRTSTEIGLSELAANSVFSIGGAGGLALGAWILRRGGLAADFIAHRTVAFFLLTSLANVSFLALGGVALAIGLLPGSPSLLLGLVPAVAAVLAIALALGTRRLAGALARRSMRARLVAGASALGEGVDEALRLLRTRDPAILAGAAGYMLFDVAILGVCFAAFGNDVPPVGVLLVAYILGQLGSLIPIPGGIGGVDAGLIGVLVLYGVDTTDAAVAVIAYRGLLLFIPAALGIPALAVLRRRLRAESHDIAACAPGESVEVLGRGVVRRPERFARSST